MTGGSPFCDSPEGCKCLFCRHPGSATPNDKEEARWTLITEDGDVVWTKYKNYCREAARAKKRRAGQRSGKASSGRIQLLC